MGQAVHEPPTLAGACVCQKRGAPFLVCTDVPCGLVAPLAVRSDFSPILVLQGRKSQIGGGPQGSK